jgi:4-amino-4-deoxy-L-arabinose transferase-like glycosyltransferase
MASQSDLTEAPDSARATVRDIAVLLCGAAAYRISFWWAMPRVVDTADAFRYLSVAQQIAAGDFGEINPRISVLYPALCAAMSGLGFDAELACRLVSLLASVLLVVPVYLIARDMHGASAARISGLIVCIWPWLADWGLRIAPESLAVTLWFVGVWSLSRGFAGQRWGQWAAPVCFFALHLTRPEGLFVLMAAPIAGLILCWPHHTKRLTALGPYAAVSAVLFVGQIALSKTLGMGATVNARLDLGGTARYVFVERGEELVQAFIKMTSHNLPVMLGPLLLIFAGAGLFASSPQSRRIRLECFVLFYGAVQAGLSVLSTWSEPRYIMATVIALSMWSARGVVVVRDQARTAGHGLVARLPVLALVLLMFWGGATTVLPEYLGRVPREPREYKIAGEWMKANLEPGLVICRKPQVGLYADMTSTGPMDYPSIERLMVWMRAINARYLVVDERYAIQQVRILEPLLDPANAPPGLTLLKADLSPYPSARLVLYEVVEPPS